MKKTFIISPVRNIELQVYAELQRITKELEEQAFIVHLPIRDTNQNATELGICTQNYNAIIESDIVHIWFDPNSVGSVFDIGVTVSHNKPLVILNSIERTEGKSFGNMILDYINMK
jgi:nucleoside 2-deoxyribosyltransferase